MQPTNLKRASERLRVSEAEFDGCSDTGEARRIDGHHTEYLRLTDADVQLIVRILEATITLVPLAPNGLIHHSGNVASIPPPSKFTARNRKCKSSQIDIKDSVRD